MHSAGRDHTAADGTRESYLWLLPTVRVKREGDHLTLREGGRVLTVTGVGDPGLRAALALDGSRVEHEVCSDPVAALLLQILEPQGWVVRLSRPLPEVIGARPWLSRQLSYFAQHVREYPDRIVDELTQRSALVIGAGGVGSHAAFSLAASGIGKITITDPDTVDATNLNRQFLYSTDDLGRSKVDCAAQALKSRFPGLVLDARCVDFDRVPDLTALPEADIVLLCGEVRCIYDRPSLIGSRPAIMAGYFGKVGAVGPLIWPGAGSPCWSCLMRADRREQYRSLSDDETGPATAWNSSGSSINAVVGHLLAEAAIRALAPSIGQLLLLGERLYLDMATFESSRERTPIVTCPHARGGADERTMI